MSIGSIDLSLIIRYMEMLHQVLLYQTVIYNLQIQTYTSGTNGRQQSINIACEKHDNCIFRRLFNGLQKSILCLGIHQLCICHNINLVWAAVWLNIHIIDNLFPDFVNCNHIWLLMGHHNDIRVILTDCLLAGITMSARLRTALFTLQCHRIGSCQQFLSRTRVTCKNIRMGHFLCLYGILQMSDYLFMSYNVVKP